MGYSIHIKRDEGKAPIVDHEWRTAVDATPGVQLMTADWELAPRNELDTEVWLADERRWVPVFRVTPLRSGKLSITTRIDALGEPSVVAALRELRQRLDASVSGDGGEVYTLDDDEDPLTTGA